jgi:hypothetical protein
MTDLRKQLSRQYANPNYALQTRKDEKNLDTIYQFIFFKSCISSGKLPPVDVLLHLNRCIDRYISGKGKVSLEQAFQLAAKTTKGGNPSAQLNRFGKIDIALNLMATERANNPSNSKARQSSVSIEKTAAMFDDSKDGSLTSTLAREYKARKMDVVMQDIRKRQKKAEG